MKSGGGLLLAGRFTESPDMGSGTGLQEGIASTVSLIN